MVIGLGTDLIEIARIQRSLQRFGAQFLERVYTPGEVAYCERKRRNAAESFAARFAAKEAAAKALGTGISRGVSWREFGSTHAVNEKELHQPRGELARVRSGAPAGRASGASALGASGSDCAAARRSAVFVESYALARVRARGCRRGTLNGDLHAGRWYDEGNAQPGRSEMVAA